jgi:hypothetical protein
MAFFWLILTEVEIDWQILLKFQVQNFMKIQWDLKYTMCIGRQRNAMKQMVTFHSFANVKGNVS